jgi:hypothetical protein
MVSSDIVFQRVQGIVKNARIIGKPKYYDDGMVEVWVEMKLENLVKAIPTNTKESEGGEKVLRRACIQEYWTKTGT